MTTEKLPPETIRIGSDGALPLLGFGTFQLDLTRAESILRCAAEHGYRHIDTAEIYDNEEVVGAALTGLKGKADQLFLTSKVWPGLEAWGYPEKRAAETLEAVDRSRSLLRRDCIDLYLIHMPLAVRHRLAVWEGLLEAKSRGWIRHAGVSNYGLGHLKEIEQAGLPMPEANQCEIHPMHPLESEHLEYMASHRVVPIAYSSLAPLGGWRLGSEWNSKEEALHGQTHGELTTQAQRLGISPAQLLLRWAIERGHPVVPKSNTLERIKENAAVLDVQLDDLATEALGALDGNRCLAWSSGPDPLYSP